MNNSHMGEPQKITGEIPVSLNLLARVNDLSIAYLKIKGLFYILNGLSWILLQSPSREAGLEWVEFLSQPVVGGIWVAGGTTSVIMGYYGSHRMKRFGFFILIMIPTVLGAYFFVSWVIYLTPIVNTEGYSRASITTNSYWTYAASAYIASKIYTTSHGGLSTEVNRGRT